MDKPKFSLSFSKVKEKVFLQPSALKGATEKKPTISKEVIESIEENVIVSNAPQQQELVIPLIQQDRAGTFKALAQAKLSKLAASALPPNHELDIEKKGEATSIKEEKELTLEEQAEQAIIDETRAITEGALNQSQSSTAVINAPTVSEKDETTGALPTEDDYEEVAVESFGLALLRGMGYEKDKGVGNIRNRKVVNIIEPTGRTLDGSTQKKPGADNAAAKQSENGEEEQLPLVKGCFVLIHGGRNRGSYGVVECVEEDHLLVRSAVGSKVLREVEANINAVTAAEYKKSSKVINKEMYDAYKAQENTKKGAVKSRRSSDDSSGNEDKTFKIAVKKEEIIKSEQQIESDTAENSNSLELNKKRQTADSNIASDSNKDERTTESLLKYDKKRSSDTSNDSEYRKKTKYQDTRYDDSKEHKTSKLKPKESNEYSQHNKHSDNNYKYQSSRYKGDSNYRPDSDYRTGSDDYYSSRDDRKLPKHKSSKQDKRDLKEDRETKERYNSTEKNSKKSSLLSKYGNCASLAVGGEAPWVCENLTVRIVSKSYKNGKYFKEKVRVKDVLTAEDVECVTDGGKLLRRLQPSMLETVIPKVSPRTVKILRGEYSGQVGIVLEQHKVQQKASVQLVSDRAVIERLGYDHICQYNC